VTGYHRKHAIRLLSGAVRDVKVDSRSRGIAKPVTARRCVYGHEVRDALIQLWEVSDRICSKRLRPMVPVLLESLERHGQIAVDEAMRSKLLAVSTASIDRLLTEVRLVAGGGRRRPAGFRSAVRRSVPIRTFNDWGSPFPGSVEVDFVAHGGTTVAGNFVQTLVLTDVARGWTQRIPIVVGEAEMVVHALRRARELFPFPLRACDFNNDGLFMNELVVDWCRAEGLEVKRSRAYRKNDQAWVEQKNGAIVRRLVGYGRLEGMRAAESPSRLFAAARLHGNLFQLSFKLKQKRREGARMIKTYLPTQPPVTRVLADASISDTDKTRLRGMLAAADPVELLADIRPAQAELGKRVDKQGLAAARETDAAPIDLDRNAQGPSRCGEASLIHDLDQQRHGFKAIHPLSHLW
jgi:hypothetical protein